MSGHRKTRVSVSCGNVSTVAIVAPAYGNTLAFSPTTSEHPIGTRWVNFNSTAGEMNISRWYDILETRKRTRMEPPIAGTLGACDGRRYREAY